MNSYSRTIIVVFIITLFMLPILAGCQGDKKCSLEVTIYPANCGSVGPTSDKYDKNSIVTLTARPYDGYAFDHWSGEIYDSNQTLSINMDSDKSITAHFKPQYSLSISVLPNHAGIVNPSEGDYDYGAKVNLMANPIEGYAFDYWSGDLKGNDRVVTITMNESKNIIAHFKEQYGLNISVDPSGSGTVDPSEGSYDNNVGVTLNAYPAEGYAFYRWSGDLIGNDRVVTITMNESKNIIAHFRERYSLNTSITPSNGGTVDPSSGTFTGGDNVTLKAIPAKDYIFSHWSGDYNGDNPFLNITFNKDRNLVANFKHSIRPPTAPIKHDSRPGGYGELTIENGTSLDGVVILTLLNSEPIMASYIRTNETYTMEGINDGNYYIYYSMGSAWDSDTKQFTRDYTYERFEEIFDFSTNDYTYTTWSITLHGIIGGTALSEDIAPNKFPSLAR